MPGNDPTRSGTRRFVIKLYLFCHGKVTHRKTAAFGGRCFRPCRSRSEKISLFSHAAFGTFRFRRMRFVAFGRPGSDLLSRVLRRSTIGSGGLNGRVRNGIGWGPSDKATRSTRRMKRRRHRLSVVEPQRTAISSPRMGFSEVTIKPIGRLVPVSFTRRRASTPGLSTWWSTTILSETLF